MANESGPVEVCILVIDGELVERSTEFTFETTGDTAVRKLIILSAMDNRESSIKLFMLPVNIPCDAS